MPFGLFKKTQKYDVLSKNSIIVCVRLLDGELIECNITTSCTGRVCLDNIAQRIKLRELEFFGIRFINKQEKWRWVDLDKPLKRQLDKYASQSRLYLGIIHYITDAHKIADERTRFLFYLQIKSDILNGTLPVSLPLAIQLASYSLQAEVGDFNPDTVQTQLADTDLVPKHLCTSEEHLQQVQADILRGYEALNGVPSVIAELTYIMEAQQLECYGADFFLAKDGIGNKFLFGVSLSGIYVKQNEQPSVFHNWSEVVEVMPNKKVLRIRKAQGMLNLQFDDLDATKYCCQLCNLQRGFFVKYQMRRARNGNESHPADLLSVVPEAAHAASEPLTESTTPTHRELHVPPDVVQSVQSIHSATDTVYERASVNTFAFNQSLSISGSEDFADYVNLGLPKYRVTPDYDSAVREKMLQAEQLRNGVRLMYASQPESFTFVPVESDSPEQVMVEEEYSMADGHYSPALGEGQIGSLYKSPTIEDNSMFSTADDEQPIPYRRPPPYPKALSQSHEAVLNGMTMSNGHAGSPMPSGETTLGRPNSDPVLSVDPYYDASLEQPHRWESSPILYSTPSAAPPRVARKPNLYATFEGGLNGRSPLQVAKVDSEVTIDTDLADEEPAAATEAPSSVEFIEPIVQVESQQALPTPIVATTRDERRIHLENKLKNGLVSTEYERVPRIRHEAMCKVASQNAIRNRFEDVLPYDENRVCLHPSMNNPSGYINASFVNVRVGTFVWKYVATQAPMESARADFWQMVWENQVKVIVMLNGLDDNGQEKCPAYWPLQRGDKAVYDGLEVSCQIVSNSASYTTSVLRLRNAQDGKKMREVWHLRYSSWPDYKSLDNVKEFLEFLDDIDGVLRHIGDDEQCWQHPVVVHCSAGVGKTGVFILAHAMRRCLEHNLPIDVSACLASLRNQRMHMVQYLTQYHLVYKALIQFLSTSRLI